MKYLLPLIITLLLPFSTARAANISIQIQLTNPVTALTQPNKWHRLAYVFEVIGAVTSLGLDGGSTEYVKSHSRLWSPGCTCYVPGAAESDALFLITGPNGPQFSQTKFWLYKSGLSLAPVAISKAMHHFFPDNTAVDATTVGLLGGLSGIYTYAAINNLHIAGQIAAENKALGH